MVVGRSLNQGKYPIVEKYIGARTVAYIRFSNLSEVGRRIWQVRDWLREHGLEKTGAPACVYSLPDGTPAVSPDCILCEVQWDLAWKPRSAALPGNGVVKTRQLEPQLVLSTFHEGDTEKIDESFAFLRQVLREEGYHEAGPRREIYLFEVCQPKSRWKTEIQIPVVK